ncbi:MAG: 2-acyl-glycerophospho-ethanolamine acyltransferase [Candidatus Scalindua rubra]|uniref:2-acyl-glycerophospho-ethanolamine acyltransferase n=1 Tax=Candidatus Scalindua rubra TaxID=1872076 RepID=A0A1E3XB34_9BACT|nr:MAG: 2-acyl-glycerophospho-ethanolamine acyltransferase [Candidatus Scalindua rubra]
MILESFIKTAKKNFNKTIQEDSTGMSLNFGQILTAGILLSKQIRNFEGDNIALMFPASVGGALAYIATSFAGKVPVGINFLAGREELDWVMNTCDIKTIFTSRKFIEKAEIPDDPRMVFIEDIKDRTSKLEKILTYLSCKIKSSQSLIQKYKEYDAPDKTAIILFTSGSESHPKGVPLTNHNIYKSVENYSTVFEPVPEDKILGTLPFFHVFGFVVCLWMPLIIGMGVVFHPNPTDYERLGKIVQRYRVTMLLGTSTLYRGFMKRWKREQVASVRLAFAGAEKLNENVRKKFYEKLGINILEGYGVTESCSCISVNYPNDICYGSVGKPLPDVQCKIVNTETYEELQPGEEGLILVKGPNVMNGYYKSPELTSKAFHDGFYITGDIEKFDNGFLYITDRLKRFAKVGGELIPLLPIEDKLSLILDEHTDDEKRKCAVVNIPHTQKGEQLVAFVVETHPDKLSLNKKLDDSGLPHLSQPDHYISIDAIPMLPSGKVDYKRIKKMAIEKFAQVT